MLATGPHSVGFSISAASPKSADSTPTDWICEDDPTATLRNCDIAKQQRNATNWNVKGYRIDYCLSELSSGPGQCRLQFSTTILAVVIVMNICKCLAMVLTLIQNREVALITVGDALASFLKKPDHLTEGRCMLAKIDVEKTLLRSTIPPVSCGQTNPPPPVTYQDATHRRWFAAVSADRWVFTLGLIGVALCAAVALLVRAVYWLKRSLDPNQSVFSLGFGTVDSRATIVDSLPKSNGAGLAAAVLVANLPQVICSLLYFAYNALFTSMLLSYEYSQYGVGGRRKALRVSSPKGQQRSKYFLHLPYTYSVPLIAISTLLHWLVSQSLFLVRITVSQDASNNLSKLGFSCGPILATTIVASVLLLAAPAFGLRKLVSHIPLASACSMALSAACHPPEDDVDAAYLTLRWGAVDDAIDSVGHCCFTSQEVRDPRPGRLYAGISQKS
ncbi:hypothetical protein LTS02_017887 [Friedmanniomyces endolithicus]|nr:hypothetical protein LTS02_017887 [Friedmanniomyces endolithicus]